MASTTENIFKTALQQAIFSCAASLDALKASRTQPPEIPEDKPTPAAVRSDFISILTLLYARSTSLTLVLKAGPESFSAAREPLTEIARDVARLAHCAGVFVVTGPTIRTEAIWAAEEVIESIQTYLVGFTRSNATGTTDPKTLMLRVGTIHSVIDRVKSSLSTDNRAAVSKRWQTDASHLDDAIREIKEMIEESESDETPEKDEFDDGWGEIMDAPGGKLAPDEVEAAQKASPPTKRSSFVPSNFSDYLVGHNSPPNSCLAS
ncbi:Grap2/cyclin-D-interacting protein [Ceratobasidium sp. AG-Ba]|nr:Grap2/cyclin-D-interacting protein [Ceratobasidium sp. AG-Ba]